MKTTVVDTQHVHMAVVAADNGKTACEVSGVTQTGETTNANAVWSECVSITTWEQQVSAMLVTHRRRST